MSPGYCVGVTTEPVFLFDQMYLVRCVAKRPECAQTRHTAADNGDAFLLHGEKIKARVSVARVIHPDIDPHDSLNMETRNYQTESNSEVMRSLIWSEGPSDVSVETPELIQLCQRNMATWRIV